MEYYDRYSKFRSNGVISRVPFVEIPVSSSDVFITFDKSRMRMDSLSFKYYGDADYGWLILQANPAISGFEYLIPDGTPLRIPYPLMSALHRYEMNVNSIKTNGEY